MHPRTILAAAAAALSIATFSAQADARPSRFAAPTVDVAAIPAYPLVAKARAIRAASRASGHAAKARRERQPVEEPREAYQRASQVETASEAGSGVVRSGKTGAIAHVAPRWRAAFQAYVDDLEAAGASVHYMGGYRSGACSSARQHPCGSALDVCQDSRGRVSGAKDCHLPGPVEMAAIAKRHGLYEGSRWCSPDYGHAQARKSADDCPSGRGPAGWIGDGHRRYLASMTGAVQFAALPKHRHTAHRYKHHRIRYAVRR